MDSIDSCVVTKDRTAVYIDAIAKDEYGWLKRKMDETVTKYGGWFLPESPQQGRLILRRLMIGEELTSLGFYGTSN